MLKPELKFDTRHYIVEASTNLTEYIFEKIGAPTDRVIELLNLGCVYVDKKRVTENLALSSGQYLRVHCKPKRYDIKSIDWEKVIVHQTKDFLIADKPPGIPVHPTVDNIRENVLAALEQHLGSKLFITQRLDVPTQGLMVFGKTPEFQRLFNKMLAHQKVKKTYVAKISHLQILGPLKHYMKPHFGSPKIVSEVPHEGWHECLLEVLKSDPKEDYFLSEIRLHTGRTHQIRAQLSAVGNPLIGDRDYGGALSSKNYFLRSQSLEFQCPITHEEYAFNATQGFHSLRY